MQYNQGEIVIVPFPFSDLTGTKQRPVLVLSNKNHKGDDIITCGITSNIKDRDHSVLLDDKNLISGGIPKISRIKTDKLFTLDRSIIRKRVAKVDPETFSKVRKELFSLI